MNVARRARDRPGRRGAWIPRLPDLRRAIHVRDHGRIEPHPTGTHLSETPEPWRLAFSEASATAVWRTLTALGIYERTILWNACPWHPFDAGNAWTNRKPTRVLN